MRSQLIILNALVTFCCLIFQNKLCQSTEPKRPITMPTRGVCAHRGASTTHPENTTAAFREAIRLGAQHIEFDVAMTKDLHLVIIHDKTVNRTTNGKGRVAELTLAEIKKLDAGSWKKRKFRGERIPTLDEVLRIMPLNVWLNVHLKGNAELGEKAAAAIAKHDRLHQAFLACDEKTAKAARVIEPSIMICNMDRQGNNVEYLKKTIKLKSNFIQFLGKRGLKPELIKQAKEKKIRVNFCCAKNAKELKVLFAAGVEFPLVDDLKMAIKVSKEIGITALKPVYRTNSNLGKQ